MFDRHAAIAAAREVLDAAPRVELSGGDHEIAVDLGALVDKIVAAGAPDALAVPAYDDKLAQEAAYRIAHPVGDDPGAHVTVIASRGAVATGVWLGEQRFVGGLTKPDAAWHLGMAYCSAAQHATRQERR